MIRATLAFILVCPAIPALAQSGPDSWSRTDSFPVLSNDPGVTETSDPDLLVVCMNMSFMFQYRISTGSWKETGMTYSGRRVTFMNSSNKLYFCANQDAVYRMTLGQASAEFMAPLLSATGANVPRTIVAAGSKVYALGKPTGYNDSVRNRFYALDPSLAPPRSYASSIGNWVALAPAPVASDEGAAMAWDGGNFIYAVFGGTVTSRYDFTTQTTIVTDTSSPKFACYSISANTWTDLADAPEKSTTGDALCIDRAKGVIYHKVSHVSRYSIAAGTWTSDSATIAGPGGMACPGSGDTLLIAGDSRFMKYSVASGQLLPPPSDAIATPMQGMLMTGTGDRDSLYVLGGGFDSTFQRYSVSAGTWTKLDPAPGGYIFSYLVHSGGDYIYAIMNNYMARYSISSGKWRFSQDANEPLIAPPEGAVIGAASRGPDGSLYVADSVANGRSDNPNGRLFRLRDDAMEWERLESPPEGMYFDNIGNFALTMSWDGGDRIYAVALDITTYKSVIIRYSIGSNAWDAQPMGPCPNFGLKAAFYYPGFRNRIYAFSGGDSTTLDSGRRFWSYATATDTWTELAIAPFFNGGCDTHGNFNGQGGNGPLAYPGVGEYLYAIPGIASQAMYRYRLPANKLPTLSSLTQRNAAGDAIGSAPIHLHSDLLLGTTSTADGDDDKVCVEVEVRRSTEGFDDVSETPGIRCALAAAGGPLAVRIPASSLEFGTSYKWRIRSVDELQGKSAWSVYAASPAFTVIPESAPIPGVVGQYDRHGAGVAVGGGVFGSASFRATATDLEGDSFHLLVEVRAAGEAFRGEATAIGAFVSSGTTAEAGQELSQGKFSWQYKVEDEFGFSTAWIPYGAGGFDFTAQPDGSTSAASFACSSSGAPALPLAAAGVLIALMLRGTAGRRLP